MATYGSETGVEAINAWLQGGYTASTQPTSTQVGGFLADGYSYINTRIKKAGYTVPVPAAATCYDMVVHLNNLYAAALAERAAAVAPSAPEGEGRSAVLWAQFREELADLLDGDLTLVGLTAATVTSAPRRSVRSLSLRRRDGYAERFDQDNTEYASGSSDDITLLEPWRLSGDGDDTGADGF